MTIRGRDRFAEFIARPENQRRLFEFINGEMIEVSPRRTQNSGYPHLLSFAVRLFCRNHRIPCFISGEAGAYRIDVHVLAPDFAYKHTPLSDDYPDPIAPEWAVEVISPTDQPDEVRAKRNIYLEAGILYWEMYPKSQSIDVYEPGKPPRTCGMGDTLNGSEVLPGFTLPVREIFASDEPA